MQHGECCDASAIFVAVDSVETATERGNTITHETVQLLISMTTKGYKLEIPKSK